MAIKLNNFVDININYNLSTSSNATRDTAVLIINTVNSNNIKSYSSLNDLVSAYESDSRFAKGGELYYYAYCFFNNGGKNLMIYEIAMGSNPTYEKVTDQSLIFKTGDEYYKTSSEGYEKANPTNLQLYVYNADTTESFADDTTYYKQNVGGYTEATPYNCDLYKSDGSSGFIPCVEGDVFSSSDTYYKDEEGTVEATPANLNLYKFEPSSETSFSTKYYYKSDKNQATPFNCNLYIKTAEGINPLNNEKIETAIKSLDNTKIVISSNASYTTMKTVCDSLYNSEEGMNIESKLILSCVDHIKIVNKEEVEKTIEDLPKESEIKSNGFILKYGTPGVQMAVAAYLTQINANRFNSVQDYYFTTESVQYVIGEGTSERTIGYICEDNSLAEALLKLEINFNSTLVDEVRNLGGNTTAGKDLVNEFMLILVHQTLTERLVQLLTQKIKYNQTGLSLIGATIADELQRYVDNGYLTTDKVWTDPDLVYKGVTIISKNTPLQIGYKYVILPLSTLSSEDRENHKLPSIYILIADSYAIRKIEIDGEVF